MRIATSKPQRKGSSNSEYVHSPVHRRFCHWFGCRGVSYGQFRSASCGRQTRRIIACPSSATVDSTFVKIDATPDAVASSRLHHRLHILSGIGVVADQHTRVRTFFSDRRDYRRGQRST